MSNPDHLAEALRRIAEEKQAKTGSLDLSGLELTELPEELKELEWLTRLNLREMPIHDLAFLAGLGQLQELICSRTQVADLAPLAGLGKLQILDCSQNDLADISSLAGLGWLEELDCEDTFVADLTPLAELSQLRILRCSETLVETLAPLKSLSQLHSLECFNTKIIDLAPLSGMGQLLELRCSYTEIVSLVPLAGLSQLQTLYCWNTRIENLEPLLGLMQLQKLDISGTAVSDLTPLSGLNNLRELGIATTSVVNLECLARLGKLKTLNCSEATVVDLSPFSPRIKDGWPVKWEFGLLNSVCVEDCPLICPPVEFAQDSPEAVVEYFEQLGEEKNLLNEIKVIFLGEGASGKTSLIKRLREEAFDPKESQTHGIRIRKTPFQLDDGQTVTAHLWDFGGQEVMHATHQFFLSQRCVYVLVLDSRKDDKADYWLKHAGSFGGNSPVLVVLNKIDENPSFEVNRKLLMEKYPSIREFFRLSCQRGDGLQAFRAALAAAIAKAPARQTPFPAAWLKVKEHFAEMDQDYIDSAAYQTICQQHGVDKKFSQGVLLQFLHDLGVVIHFRHLKNFDTQILNPLWLTNGVYRIINSEKVAQQGGLLHENDLDRVINNPVESSCHTGMDAGIQHQDVNLAESVRHPPWPGFRHPCRNDDLSRLAERDFFYPPDKLNYIVRVMEEFELCYPLDGHRYIVPQLLRVEEPDFEKAGVMLHFIIRFSEFLPDSTFPRLMVKLHPFIKGELRWRTGMVLEKRNVFDATARVRADKEDKEIRIDVCGSEPRRFLSFIRETVKEIVADFANLPVTEWVPVPGCGEMLEYDYLVEAEKAGEKEVFVRELKKRVLVKDLLDGVEEAAMREEQTPVKAFISYSHKDTEYLQALKAALSPLVRLEKLRLWDDHAIDAGEEWHETIFRELGEADLVLCLVSADFIHSDFCYAKELKAAMDAHESGEKTVVPIRLRECAWEGLPLAKLQGKPAQWISAAIDKDAAWTEVAKGLHPAIEKAKARKTSHRA